MVDMWAFLFVISSGLLWITDGKLFGNHVCLFNESSITNISEPYKKHITIRKYKWCLNVPPRCSYYTTEEITDIRTVEKVEQQTVEQCCPGFYEENNHCVPNCESDCENKVCSQRICVCVSGFKGEKCDTICSPGFWGSNCMENCKCTNQTCNPFTGDCFNDRLFTIENGTDNNRSNGIFDHGNRNISKSDSGTSEHEFGNTKMESNTKESIYNDNLSSSTTASIPYTEYEYYDMTKMPTVTEISTLQTSIELEPVSDVPIPSRTNAFEDKTTRKSVSENNKKYTTERNFLMNEKREFLIPVQIKYDNEIARPLIKNDIIVTTDTYNFNTIDRNHSVLPVEGNLVTIISISAATTTAVILLAIVLFSILKIKKSKRRTKDEGAKKNVGVSTVSVYTTSIFHTPLPDPPTYEEKPTNLSPMDYQNCSNELKSFQTHIVCNMTKKTPINSSKSSQNEYTYDHPPSTESYRAASVVDTLDVDASNIVQAEPVYEELPCQRFEKVNDTSYYSHPKTLYMNIHGITKF